DAEALVTDSDMTITFGVSTIGDGGMPQDGPPPGRDGPAHDLAVPDGADLAVVTQPCPNVMFAVDRTASTDEAIAPGGTGSKFAAEVASVNTMVSEYSNRVPIGLTLFGDVGTTDCTTGTSVVVEPTFNDGAIIANALAIAAPTGSGNNDVALQLIQSD